jgi:hypothetical protein
MKLIECVALLGNNFGFFPYGVGFPPSYACCVDFSCWQWILSIFSKEKKHVRIIYDLGVTKNLLIKAKTL